MARYLNCIFDLYGTLADIRTDERSQKLWRLAALYYSEHGAGYQPTELKKAYLRLCKCAQEREADPLFEIELREVFSSLYFEKGIIPDGRLVAETAVFFRLSSLKKLKLYPWVKPVFKALRESGCGIYLLSNAQACFTEPELRALGIENDFDDTLLSSDAGVRKPSPAIMRRLLEENGLEAGSCVMVGNDRRADIALANAFGMDSVYIKTETSVEEEPLERASYELLDGDFARLPELLGI